MKKRLSIALLVFILSLLLTDMVLAAYTIGIDVTESNDTDYDMLAMTVSMDIDYLADNGFINEDGLDVRVKNSQGTELPFMPADDKLMFASPIVGDKTTGFQMTTGNTPLSSFDVVVGDGGYVTISDHANLELGDDFELEFEGYIDTSVDTSPSITTSHTSSEDAQTTTHTVDLPGGYTSGNLLLLAFGCFDPDSDSPTVSSPNGWTQLDEYESVTQAHWLGYKIADGTEGSTVTITTTKTGYSAHQTFRFSSYSGVPEVSAKVQVPNDPNPNSENLATSWGTSGGSRDTFWMSIFCAGYAISRTVSSYPANYDGGTLAASSSGYAYVGSAYRLLSAAAENPGQYTLSANANWAAWTVGISGNQYLVGKEGSYGLYVEDGNIVAELIGGSTLEVATTQTSGEYVVNVWADTTNFGIDIDDSTEDSTALGGVSATDNGNDWLLVPVYYDYYTHTTSDTLRITYEPDSIIVGTTLPNEENPGTYDGAITWGANPAGIAITYSGLEVEESYYYTGGAGTTTDVFAPEPAELVTGIDSDKLDHNPLSPGVEGFAQASNGAFTESLVWYGIAWFSIIAVGIALIILVREHLVFAAASSFGLSIFWYVSGVFDYWVLIILGILLGATLIHERMPTW